MKPIFQRLTSSPEEGFGYKVIRGDTYDCPWHFHPESEIILVLKSGGYRMVGDDLTPLHPGDLVMVGPNLPHIWQNDSDLSGRAPAIHAILIQFQESFLTDGLLRLPAMLPVRRLLKRSTLGLQVRGRVRNQVADLMTHMAQADELHRVLMFLEILGRLAESVEVETIASPGFNDQGNPFDQERMNRVCQYLNERIDQTLTLVDVARVVHLSEGAFSRFFRLHTGKTFPAFVNEIRVGRACRLLAETELNVTEVAMACGFNNLSNFNRQFLRLKRVTPTEFRRQLKFEHE